MPKLYRILVPVSDIERAQSFYAAVLGSVGQRVSPGRHYFDCEGTILACFDPAADSEGRSATPNPEDIYIAVDDIEETFENCRRAGAQAVTADSPATGPLGRIHARPWGEVSFYVKDPFGNPLCFVDRATVFTGND
jgi:catechol 2,3-dioxygenase-like lactoylglutathione lyase family enzyme